MSLRRLERLPAGVRFATSPSTAPATAAGAYAELTGRVTELSGRGAVASLSVAAALLLEAQAAGAPCAWVTRGASTFFPPDFARAGIDLGALAVVFGATAAAAAGAAARLVRSGAFGLVVVDLGAAPELPMGLQGRLGSLASEHDAAVVLLTDKPADAPSVGALISLRIEARRRSVGESRFVVEWAALKDRRRGPGWSREEVVDGPAGLR